MGVHDRSAYKPHIRARKVYPKPKPEKMEKSMSTSLLEYFPIIQKTIDFFNVLLKTLENVIKSPTTWKTLIRGTFFLTIITCLYALSWAAYISFYALFIPKLSSDIPVYFNYGVNSPFAEIITVENNEPKIFQYGQAYDLTLNLEVPESEANFEIGNFMVRLELQNKDRDILYDIDRPAILKYRSDLLRKLSTYFYSLPLIVDWATQKQIISIVLAEQFLDDYDNIVSKIFISISNPKIQIYKSWLKVEVKLTGIKYIMYYWPLTAALLFTSFFFFGEILFTLASWQIILFVFKRFTKAPTTVSNLTTSAPEFQASNTSQSNIRYVPISKAETTAHRSASPPSIKYIPVSNTKSSSNRSISPPTLLDNTTEEDEWESLSQNQSFSPKTFKSTVKKELDSTSNNFNSEPNDDVTEELKLAREVTDNLYSSYFGQVTDDQVPPNRRLSRDSTLGRSQEYLSAPEGPSSSNRDQRTTSQQLDHDQRSNTLIEEFDEENDSFYTDEYQRGEQASSKSTFISSKHKLMPYCKMFPKKEIYCFQLLGANQLNLKDLMKREKIMAESRVDLLRWVNNVCQSNYSKIEQCGTGAAYCIIMDSIYGDIPLSKVKFDCKGEHEYIANFKILQNCFTKHKIDKVIPVDRLIKLKMQDNLEFVQWIKKFWQMNCENQDDHELQTKRRSAAATPSAPVTPSVRTVPKSTPKSANRTSMQTARKILSPTTKQSTQPQNPRMVNRTEVRSRASQNSSALGEYSNNDQRLLSLHKEIAALTDKVLNLNALNQDLVHEREFYFNRLTAVEQFIQEHIKQDPLNANDFVLKQIQSILFHSNSNDTSANMYYNDDRELDMPDEYLDGIEVPEGLEDEENDGIF